MVHISILQLALPLLPFSLFFFFNDTATTEIYTLSLHDALPICALRHRHRVLALVGRQHAAELVMLPILDQQVGPGIDRSEEHTSELQSLTNLVCRLLLEKKKKIR